MLFERRRETPKDCQYVAATAAGRSVVVLFPGRATATTVGTGSTNAVLPLPSWRWQQQRHRPQPLFFPNKTPPLLPTPVPTLWSWTRSGVRRVSPPLRPTLTCSRIVAPPDTNPSCPTPTTLPLHSRPCNRTPAYTNLVWQTALGERLARWGRSYVDPQTEHIPWERNGRPLGVLVYRSYWCSFGFLGPDKAETGTTHNHLFSVDDKAVPPTTVRRFVLTCDLRAKVLRPHTTAGPTVR